MQKNKTCPKCGKPYLEKKEFERIILYIHEEKPFMGLANRIEACTVKKTGD